MTTDRELLELAAKAARLSFWVENEWNPLTDDGDALRLAVKLGMLFTYMQNSFELFQRLYLEELDNDLCPSEATRRAIVRAAAAIGEKL